jgi:uncharacterized membrane protein
MMLGPGTSLFRFLFGALASIVATVIVLEWAIGEFKRMWPYLAGALVIGSGVWLLVLWRRRRGYY